MGVEMGGVWGPKFTPLNPLPVRLVDPLPPVRSGWGGIGVLPPPV